MRLAGAFLLAVSLASQALAQDASQELSSARGLLDAVRAEIGAQASLPECSGQLEQICKIKLGRSFVLTTDATSTGDILAVKLLHDEIEIDPPEKAAGFVGAVVDVIAGDLAGEVTALLNEAVQSDGPVEREIGGILYRADAGAEVFLEIKPGR